MMRITKLFLAVLLLASTSALAGPPLIENSEIEAGNVEGSLSSAVHTWAKSSSEASWLGWHVTMTDGEHELCCWSQADLRSQSRACELEGSHRHFVFSSDRPSSLPDSENLVILLRSSNGELTEMGAYTERCQLDAGGRPVTWLEGVDPTQSVDLLVALVESNSAVEDEALMAIALHATPAAAVSLAAIARQSASPDLRGESLFWLSQRGEADASEIILQAVAEDPDSDVREEAIFALSQLPDQRGIPMLLRIIQDRSRPSALREQAFFWYVQSGDDEALDLIAELLTN